QWAPQVTEVGDVAGGTAAAVGMAVQKRGRTTEHTFGMVVSTDATVTLDYGDGLGSRTLRRQIRVETDTSRSARFSNRGDSGSVVMTTDRRVVGLLFAGSTDGQFTFANPLQDVLDELGVDLAVARRPVLTRPVRCWPTRLTLWCPPTRSPLGCHVLTRDPWICPPLTRSPLGCHVLTRDPRICPPFTRNPDFCLTITRSPAACEIPTRLGPCPPISRGVCDPGELFPPLERPGQFGGGDYGDTVGAEASDYWAGYLAALEEVAATYEEADADEGGADR
ncbi:MAG TPA: hypothetical protein VMM13_11610, partial [Euzebya sp.]|nr:hypothetical protein [Euzebya sp.]